MADIKIWNPEDEEFWESEGKQVASRNLWISIPSLLCGFAVWLYWSIITVQMLNLGFPFDAAQLFTITAIAGFTGATLRIPNSFFIRISGGRNTIFLTTALLILPAVGTGFALLSQDTPLWVFQVLALLSGLGGGNFASSMSNISFFYPKSKQGLALGLNAGLGNAGVTTMQLLIPLVMTKGIFGGGSMILETDSGTLIGKISAGTATYIQNAGWVWVVFLVPLAILIWTRMNNITNETVSPNIGSTTGAFGKILGMLLIAFGTAAAGLYFIIPSEPTGLPGLGLPSWIKWPVMAAVLAGTVYLLKLLPGDIRPNLQRQYQIFKNKHTWVMSVIYTMTFGSFIGFSAGFALAIKVVFGFKHIEVDGVMTHDLVNPDGPSALSVAWLGPFIGAFIRPVGGWIADRVGGARVTQYVAIVMIISSLGVAYYLREAYQSPTPQDYFLPFFLLFLVLFAATGIGNGSTFRTIAIVFNKEQAGPVLGWTSAVAAYGAFIIPQEFGQQIKAATPHYALAAFAAFYAICLLLNWWFYLGPKAEFKNP